MHFGEFFLTSNVHKENRNHCMNSNTCVHVLIKLLNAGEKKPQKNQISVGKVRLITIYGLYETKTGTNLLNKS